MINNKKISLIIPCRNEEAALYSLLQKVPSYVDEVIVVDNNSKDNTVRVAKANGATVYIEKKETGGVGYGFAHQTGLKKATGDYIIALDGDNTYPVRSIKEIVTYMEKNMLDFVSCNRLPLSNGKTITPTRRMGIKILNFWASFLFGYRLNDILTGMWAVRKSAVKKLNAISGGWNYSPEVKLAAISNPDIFFSEYHIPYYLRVNGVSKLSMWKTGFDHFIFILERKIKFEWAFVKEILRTWGYQLSKSARSLF